MEEGGRAVRVGQGYGFNGGWMHKASKKKKPRLDDMGLNHTSPTGGYPAA